jgi:tripartite-type tricarboxylate transporter receptor subunit TctC
MRNFKGSLNVALAVIVTLLLVGSALAQDYPNHVVKVIVPYPVGGATDITARLVAEKLTQKWRVGVIVENRPGVNGVIGTEAVGQAPADGYTIGFVASSHVVNPALYKKLPYALSDFKPVTVTTQVQMGLVVNAHVPVNNVQELIKYIKDNPGKITYGTTGEGGFEEMRRERDCRARRRARSPTARAAGR